MWCLISGRVIAKKDRALIVETAAGIGFLVHCTSVAARTPVRSRVRLFCSFHPEAQDIFGFLEEGDLDAFLLLTTVSGIGPKNALKILQGMPRQKLFLAISKMRTDVLAKKTGISHKTASKIAVELKDKVSQLKTNFGEEELDELEAREVLEGLGYGKRDVEYALSKVAREKNVKEMIRKALALLSRK